MRRPAVLIALLGAAVIGCGDDDEPPEPAPRPVQVQERKKPVWCPRETFKQVRRSDGRYDVERVPHGTFDARDLLGLRQDAAEELAQRNDCSIRVVRRDGEALAATDDLRPNRINVAVTRGVVTAVRDIG